MNMESKKRNNRIVFTTFVLSSLVLAVGTYFFINSLMPLYRISAEEIRFILVRLLPIITGLLLTIVALIIAPPKVSKSADISDDIPIDELTAPLYVMPDEDAHRDLYPELETVEPSTVQKKVVEEHLSRVETALPSDLEKVVTPPVILDTQQILSNDEQPLVEEEVFDAGIEEETEEIIEQEEEEVAAASVLPTSQIDRQILFSAYPFPIEEGTAIAELLEPIAASNTSSELENPSLYETTEDTYPERLSDEIIGAKTLDYDLSIAVIATDGTKELCDTLSSMISISSIQYREGNRFYLILPFYSFDAAGRSLTSLFARIRKLYPDAVLSCGYATLSERNGNENSLSEEMETSLNIAIEHGGYSIIGYDPVIEEA